MNSAQSRARRSDPNQPRRYWFGADVGCGSLRNGFLPGECCTAVSSPSGTADRSYLLFVVGKAKKLVPLIASENARASVRGCAARMTASVKIRSAQSIGPAGTFAQTGRRQSPQDRGARSRGRSLCRQAQHQPVLHAAAVVVDFFRRKAVVNHCVHRDRTLRAGRAIAKRHDFLGGVAGPAGR